MSAPGPEELRRALLSPVGLLPAHHGFTRQELARVGVDPQGERNIFVCRQCGWSVGLFGAGALVPHFVVMRGVREVVTHWQDSH